MAESVLVGILSAAIATISLGVAGGLGMPETAAMAMLTGGGATTCMLMGQA